MSSPARKKNINKPSLHYAAGLDPWLRTSAAETEHLIKLSLLTSSHIVISDNQALNCSGLHHLLRREDAAKFLLTPCDDSTLPLVISLRGGVNNFEQVLFNLLIEREKPPIFPWMNKYQQNQIDKIYCGSKIKTLGPLFDTVGTGFEEHINLLDKLVLSQHSSKTRWKGLNQQYPELVSKATQKLIKGLEENTSPIQKQMLDVCKIIVREIDGGIEVNRSNMFRIIQEKCPNPAVLKAVILKILDEPYHFNFAKNGKYHLITGSEYHQIPTDILFSKVFKDVSTLKPSEILEIDRFPLSIAQIPYARLSSIRKSYSFRNLTAAIADNSQDSVYALRDMLDLVSAELTKEPSTIEKLGRLRLKAFLPPNTLRDHLAEVGLSLADLAGLGGKAGGFLAGETIGQLIGIFGIGGMVGASAAVFVEHLTQEIVIKPQKQREFNQIVHLLLAPDPDNENHL